MDLKRYISPALALLLLSPAVGEMLSGSSPPLKFFNPTGFFFLLCLYGGGAIIIRELALRWNKGWPSILVMGAAYGIVEEGLMVKSFFNPDWVGLGILGSYGRWLGVNWVWATELMVFHAVFSITIPILLVTLAYPEKRSVPWVGRRIFFTLCALLVFTVVFGYFFLSPYAVPPGLYAAALACVVILVAIARWLPGTLFTVKDVKSRKPRWFFLLGLAWGTIFFIIAWAIPAIGVPPIVTVALFVLSVVALSFALIRMSGNGGGWSGRHQLALVSGVLGFLIALSPILELNGMAGMTVVGILFAALLAWLYIALGRREKANLALIPSASEV
jgi:hypothetical protein